VLVVEEGEDGEDFVQAILLQDREDEPGFSIIEFADAKKLGKASGLNETDESMWGFPSALRRATVWDAHRDQDRSHDIGQEAA
jgi:hypothetical protein